MISISSEPRSHSYGCVFFNVFWIRVSHPKSLGRWWTKRNRWIQSGHGFIGLSDAQGTEWSCNHWSWHGNERTLQFFTELFDSFPWASWLFLTLHPWLSDCYSHGFPSRRLFVISIAFPEPYNDWALPSLWFSLFLALAWSCGEFLCCL